MVVYRLHPSMSIFDEPDRWAIEWSNSALSGKRVTLTNRVTGQTATGFDWTDWDEALRLALASIDEQGDLVTEVEEYLRDGRR